MNAAHPSTATTARTRVMALALLTVAILAGVGSPSALALPEGRAYEMVSPPYKAGYGVVAIRAVAPSGESVAFTAQGAFAGQPSFTSVMSYLARRAPSGWSTSPLDAPAALAPAGSPTDYSANLGSVLADALPGTNAGAAETQNDEGEFMLHSTQLPDIAADWEVPGDFIIKTVNGEYLTMTEAGASADLCHLLLETRQGTLTSAAMGTSEQFYELSAGCGDPPALRMLGSDNMGKPIDSACPAWPGMTTRLPYPSGLNRFNDVSATGQAYFFSADPIPGDRCNSAQLFVRLGGLKTLEVSKSLSEEASCVEVPCGGSATRPVAQFEGASEDGSRVFFTTKAPLTGDDGDLSTNLFMATIGCPASEEHCEISRQHVTSLVQVSHDPTVGEAAEVQGVVRVAPDGDRVYFVARGVLSTGANAEGRLPVSGADNLYVSEGAPGAPPVFVADLCSGPGLSGLAQDSSCPSELSSSAESPHNDTNLWLGIGSAEDSTGDGEFLVFSTWGQLLPRDTDNAMDVYRYDAGSGTLTRVSLGENGADADGNSNDDASETPEPGKPAFADATIVERPLSGIEASYEQREMGTRAISEDGSRIVFSTAAPLSSQATNGLSNIYEWHMESGWSEGSVSIVSSGSAPTPDHGAVISPSGNDVFFETSAGLVPQDTDGQLDVYDARLDGGFPPASAAAEECSGDACQGALTNPAPLLVPGSSSQAAGENLPAPVTPPKGTPTTRKAKARPRCARGKHRSHGKCVDAKRKSRSKRASDKRGTN